MGRLEEKSITIPYLGSERKLRIYVPEKYDKDSKMKFPVLYLHDGQNMFVDEDATYGCSWKAGNAMELLEAEGYTDGIIMVGIDNDGIRRLDEYSPWINEMEINFDGIPTRSWGGEGDKYAEFIVNTLKPYIDREYRTLSEREYTGIAGSSMGGYISLYMGAKYTEVFSKIGGFSTASWFNETEFLKFLDQSPSLSSQKYYLHIGTQETFDRETNTNNVEKSQQYIDTTLRTQRKLIEKGVLIENLKLVVGVDEYHHEKYWEKHFPEFIKFIFNKI
ncbi:MAG: putative esterase [Clostridiales bacterium]|jgi:predicted alpha/beta superfamily hydrolase|nr:putative esterase [Clostridiales bacterium]